MAVKQKFATFLLSCADNIESCFIQMQFLKQRILNFSEVKKHELIDEVYTANCVEIVELFLV